MNACKNIIDRLNSSNGFSKLELDTNIEIKNLVNLIANEQKSSYLLDFDNDDWDSKVWNQGENGVTNTEMVDIVNQLLSENPNFSSKQLANLLQQKEIPNIDLKFNRTVAADGIVSFNYYFPELNFINNNILDGDEDILYKKVFQPFYKYLNSHKDQITNSNNGMQQPLAIPDKVVNSLTSLISKKCIEQKLDPEAVSKYCIHNIFKFGSKSIQDRLINNTYLQPVNKNKPFSKLAEYLKNRKVHKDNIINICLFQAYNVKEDSERKINTLINGISSQLYMNSQDLDNVSSEEIEKIIKTGYNLYTKENQDYTYNVDKHGYRTVNVGFGDKDVLLHCENDNIKKAMGNLTNQMANLVQNKENITDEEYMKQVSLIHFRYVSIHPFRDSNGRTGRNIINMLTLQKNKFFILDKKDKRQYLDVMNEITEKIPNQEYLESLVDSEGNPSKYDKPLCGNLVKFITERTKLYNELSNHQPEFAEKQKIQEERNL